MNPTAMQATGLVYIGRNPRPIASTDASGRFQLVFDAIDCLGPHAKEGWTLVWCGAEAAAFWRDHADALRTPGQPLRVTATHLRAHVAGRVPGIHAHVLTCELAPCRAPAASTPQPETV